MRNLLFTLSFLSLFAAGASAQQHHVMLQNRDTSTSPPTETYIWNYDSYTDMAAHNGSFDSWNADVANTYHAVEFEYDGMYRVILQARDTAATPPNETFVWSYNTYNDMINHNGSFQSWAADVASDYHMVGFGYDGQYRVMLQNRSTAGGPPTETYIWSYGSYNDFINHNNGSFVSWQADVLADYITTGLTYDGQYRLMLQKRDTSGGVTGESFLWTFNTFNDLVNLNGSAEQWQADVIGNYRAAGLAYTPVPEPATMVMIGLGAAAILRRRNRK